MTTRVRLPDRRYREGFDIEHDGIRYAVCIGRHPDGRLGELFLSTTKAGTSIDAIARDAALMFSLLIQYGCPVQTIKAALTRGPEGRPAGVLGRALELIGDPT